MFEHLSYVGYTVLFCAPPLVLMWLRREFFLVLAPRFRGILLASVLLTVYGSLIWPVALHYGAWAYRDDRITGLKLLGYVYVDDVFWWFSVSFLFASFVTLATYYERRGVDLIAREVLGLLRSFGYAFRGLRVVPLERNSTIHVAVGVFVVLEAALFGISAVEWLLVVIAASAVLAFEILNSAVERLADRTGQAGAAHPDIALIKDAAAAGVLVSTMAAVLVGANILLTRALAALAL